jgi:hypothetical protein
MFSNMKARLLLRERQSLTETAFIEVVIWHVPKPVSGSEHDFKYSLVLVAEGVCVMRYDNEAGKGDHRHVAGREVAYRFIDLSTLQTDFWNDVESWRAEQ